MRFTVFISKLCVCVLSAHLFLFTTPSSANVKGGYFLEISKVGGYLIVPEAGLSLVPSLYVHNGIMYKPGNYAGEVVYPIRKTSVNKALLHKSLDDLYAVAVEPTNGFGRVPIEDAAYTYIKVGTPAGVRVVSVYIPSYNEADLSMWVGPEAAEARLKLLSALKSLEGLTGRSSTFRPSTLEFWQSDRLFGDSSSSVARLKYAPKLSSVKGCFTVKSSSLPAGLKDALRFRMPDGSIKSGFFRPVLPGEVGCLRSNRVY